MIPISLLKEIEALEARVKDACAPFAIRLEVVYNDRAELDDDTNILYKVMLDVCDMHGYTIDQLHARCKARAVSDFRISLMCSIYYLHAKKGYTNTAKLFKRDHSTVISHVRTLPGMLMDPIFSAKHSNVMFDVMARYNYYKGLINHDIH
jgi:chromosomal replication initiation ATPase DnaA